MSSFDGCEWEPSESRPALSTDEHFKTTPAVLMLGSPVAWRLCRECAGLPDFKRFRKRKDIVK